MERDPDPYGSSQPGGRRPLLRRREVLVLGFVGVLTPWIPAPARAAKGGTLELPAEPMSIGFVEGSEAFPNFSSKMWKTAVAGRLAASEGSAPGRLRVVPADSLPLGDQNLAGGQVRIRLHGLYPRMPGKAIAVESVDLDVLYPSPDPALSEPLPFHAWSFRRLPAPSGSPPLSFEAPLGLDGQLDLVLTVVSDEGTDQLVRRRYVARFTVDWQDGVPKLQRGMYLLGIAPVWKTSVRLPMAGERPRMDLLSLALSIDPVVSEP
jgi:hypothetical protein